MIRSYVYFLLGGLVVTAAFGQSPRPSQFDDFKGDGYYWYRQDPEPVKPKKALEQPKPAAAAASTPQEPKPLSTEWLRANMPRLLDMAVDNPTTENVANYMYGQRVLLDKSQNFSEKVKEVVASDPFLDENNRVPIAQFAQPSFTRGVKKGQDDVLSFLAGKGGLWVFVDGPEKCSACEGYVKDILVGTDSAKGVATQHGFNFKQIDVRTDAGRIAAKRLNLKVTPTTVLVVPPNGFYLVSQGLMSQTQLSDRLLIAGKAAGHLTKELEEKVNPYNKGVLTPDELAGIGGSTEPSEVMKAMRERIKGEK